MCQTFDNQENKTC